MTENRLSKVYNSDWAQKEDKRFFNYDDFRWRTLNVKTND